MLDKAAGVGCFLSLGAQPHFERGKRTDNAEPGLGHDDCDCTQMRQPEPQSIDPLPPEMWLRTRAGGTTYAGSFVQHWLQRILYYDAPTWVFTLVYSLFGLAVVATWWYFPPTSKRRAERGSR